MKITWNNREIFTEVNMAVLVLLAIQVSICVLITVFGFWAEALRVLAAAAVTGGALALFAAVLWALGVISDHMNERGRRNE